MDYDSQINGSRGHVVVREVTGRKIGRSDYLLRACTAA